MNTEIVYLGRDNWIDVILRADGAAVNLTSVTKMTLTFGASLIQSNNGDAAPIRWARPGYVTGQVKMFLGGQAVNPGNYQAVLIVYDAVNSNGIVWGRIPIAVMADPEAPG